MKDQPNGEKRLNKEITKKKSKKVGEEQQPDYDKMSRYRVPAERPPLPPELLKAVVYFNLTMAKRRIARQMAEQTEAGKALQELVKKEQ